MESLGVVILAGGLGKRLKQSRPKALTPAAGRPLIHFVLDQILPLRPARTVVVVGHGAEQVEAAARVYDSQLPAPIKTALQPKQLGTGDAAKCALTALEGFKGTVLILYGDMPLLKTETLDRLVEQQSRGRAALTLLTANAPQFTSLGRIIRSDADGAIQAIREARDCSPREALIGEVNVGVYAVESAFLEPALLGLKNENAQGEYYLTDIVSSAICAGRAVSTVLVGDVSETLGVNDVSDLLSVQRILRARTVERHVAAGVGFVDPDSVHIEPTVTIKPGTVIGPNVQLLGGTKIGANVTFEGTAILRDVTVGDGALLRLGVRAESAAIGANAQIGPFAHLRPGTELAQEVHIGNFVETKKAVLAPGVKANHLTYLGDVTIGEGTNIGAGTITCNYDGMSKHQTTIGKNVFVGSDTCFVAPVTIEDGATIGAGSVITKNVEADSLALTRAPLKTKPGWSKKRRGKG